MEEPPAMHVAPSLSRRRFLQALGSGLATVALPGCFAVRPPNGGALAFCHRQPRWVDPAAVGVPPGYCVDVLAQGLTYPTGVILDDADRVHIVEGGFAPGDDFCDPRLLRLEPDGEITVIATGERNGPWCSGCFHQGAFYISEGGQRLGGRILRITPDGTITSLIDHLPTLGTHHTNRIRMGPDGHLYFSIGTATNAGVVGRADLRMGWLKRFPEFHDVSPVDVVLTGQNFCTRDYLSKNTCARAVTGAYVPFGTSTTPGQVIPGRNPGAGAIYRLSPEGGGLELVAWGFRNTFALAFTPEGRLFAVDDDPDDWGSRPLFGTGGQLWCVEPGTWYGWPDYWGGVPVTDPRFKPPHKPQPKFLLAEHPGTPPEPAGTLGDHSVGSGLDFSFNPAFGHAGEAFVALFGDMSPGPGKVLHPVGFRVVRVDPCTGVIEDFLINKGPHFGPASKIGGGGLERPVDVRFNNDGSELYVTDFGRLSIGLSGVRAYPGSGVLWRVRRDASAV